MLGRLPYGADTVPVKGFDFEEVIDAKHDNYVWMNAAFAMGVNINRSHKLYGWGTQIRGVESGGSVINLPVHSFPTDDGSVACSPTSARATSTTEVSRWPGCRACRRANRARRASSVNRMGSSCPTRPDPGRTHRCRHRCWLPGSINGVTKYPGTSQPARHR